MSLDVRRGRMPPGVVWLLVGINVLWGGSSLAAKLALGSASQPHFPPMMLAFARFALAALLMYGVAVWRGVDLRVSRRDWGRFWAMGVLGLALAYLLNYVGLQKTEASVSALLIATEPVFLALLSFLLLGEAMPAVKVGGIAAGLAGVALIVTDGALPRHLSGAFVGDLLIALGLIAEAGSSIVGKRLVARYPAIAVITYEMIVGAIALSPFAVSELLRRPSLVSFSAVPLSAWLGLLYLVVPCTVFAYTVWFTVLDRWEPGEMAVFLFVQPVVGMALGAWLLHERVTVEKALGAALVLLAVGLIQRRPSLPEVPLAPPSA